MKIQLLSETHDASEFISSDEWCAQEKIDGERMLVQKIGTSVTAYNRRGLGRKLSESVLTIALSSVCDWIIDGEAIGDDFIAFDILEINGADICKKGMEYRFDILSAASPFRVVRCAIGADSKSDLVKAVRAESGEGVVFKFMDEPYLDGRTPAAVKFKFWKSESFVVTKIEGECIRLMCGKKDFGKCHVPSGIMPEMGSVVDVRFASISARGKCVHPSYLGVRNDLEARDV